MPGSALWACSQTIVDLKPRFLVFSLLKTVMISQGSLVYSNKKTSPRIRMGYRAYLLVLLLSFSGSTQPAGYRSAFRRDKVAWTPKIHIAAKAAPTDLIQNPGLSFSMAVCHVPGSALWADSLNTIDLKTICSVFSLHKTRNSRGPGWHLFWVLQLHQ